ncbi:hypothetical protein [Streptomyces sp. NPDC102264]|uniref:hypothetical protein n=1 Tax=Streptomyces sp. NPDC102264 TaxID=3366149 RepID=UPI003830D7A6
MHPVYEGWLTLTSAGKTPAHYLNLNGERVRCVTDDVLPQMIPADFAARARRLVSGHQLFHTAKPQTGRRVHPLTGLLRCADCGHAMSYGGGSYERQHYSGGGSCNKPASVSRLPLERYIVDGGAARLHGADDDDALMIAVAERWQAHTCPDETQEIKDARAELKAAQAKLDKFMADDAADFYTGRSARYRIPHKVAAERRPDAAEARIRDLTGGTRVGSLLRGQERAGIPRTHSEGEPGGLSARALQQRCPCTTHPRGWPQGS